LFFYIKFYLLFVSIILLFLDWLLEDYFWKSWIDRQLILSSITEFYASFESFLSFPIFINWFYFGVLKFVKKQLFEVILRRLNYLFDKSLITNLPFNICERGIFIALFLWIIFSFLLELFYLSPRLYTYFRILVLSFFSIKFS
jgi:hypothetical protein